MCEAPENFAKFVDFPRGQCVCRPIGLRELAAFEMGRDEAPLRRAPETQHCGVGVQNFVNYADYAMGDVVSPCTVVLGKGGEPIKFGLQVLIWVSNEMLSGNRSQIAQSHYENVPFAVVAVCRLVEWVSGADRGKEMRTRDFGFLPCVEGAADGLKQHIRGFVAARGKWWPIPWVCHG